MDGESEESYCDATGLRSRERTGGKEGEKALMFSQGAETEKEQRAM